MSVSKWLIFCLVMLVWCSAMVGMNAATGRTGSAIAGAIVVVAGTITFAWCLTKQGKP